MAYRITINNLSTLALRLNEATGAPLRPYDRPLGSDKHIAQIGNYHISQAYGGYCLHRMTNESGGVTDVFSCGHIPARELFERMHAFMRGMELGRELAQAKGAGHA